MSGNTAGGLLLALVIIAAIVALVIWALHRLYRRSSKELSFVRTGFGGQAVILDGGALVLPIVHEVTPVNMRTLRLEVRRGRESALITRNRMRVDVIAEFYVRVAPRPEAVATAAQTLGRRTLEPDGLKELVEGRFVDALRATAAELTMEEMHEKRGEYVRRVKAHLADGLAMNGLELEAVSLTALDQTNMEYFNPSNAFDAEGLTRLTEEIERRKKLRNDIEQDTLIQIRNKNLEAERQSLTIERDTEYARLEQERELEIRRAVQRAEVARERAEREREAEEAQLGARERTERARIALERAIDGERIARERDIQGLEVERRTALELAEQQRAISVAEASRAQSVAQAAAEEARGAAVAAEERVFTIRETEIAERRRAIDLVEARQNADREAVRIRTAAEAERDAATDRATAARTTAEADAQADSIRAEATRTRMLAEAEGQRALNDAQNSLSDPARAAALRMRLVEKLDAIIRESVRPMERIESIRILNVEGLQGNAAPAVGASRDAPANLADNLVNSALRYRAQAPLIDSLLREVGVQPGSAGVPDLGALFAEPRATLETPKRAAE